ncbi:MAG: hypothetical protein K2Z81_01595 [Cyanobacteria bacterium]|nr:hypothetical protein [Cyanobacteriota bacterium]
MSLLNEKGQRLEPLWAKDSFELARATKIEYRGKLFETPFGRELAISRLLKPVLSEGKLRTAKGVTEAELIHGWKAVLLPSGKVFICGGQNNYQCTNLSWIFDPANGQLDMGPGMISARSNASLLLLTDGRVLISGGASEGEPLNNCEIFEEKKNKFEPIGPLVVPRLELGLLQLNNGKVLILGGSTKQEYATQTGGLTSQVEILDLEKKSHVKAGSAFGRTEPILIATNKCDALVVGGWFEVNNLSGDVAWVRDAEMFYPTLDDSDDKGSQ